MVLQLKMIKTGHLTLTVIQKSGVRFKTLGKNVVNTTSDQCFFVCLEFRKFRRRCNAFLGN
ncbi:MAG: hypothetical protein RLZZ211_992 [Bacteroidota bacterium]|jgi:hypothetical protein